MVGSNASVGVAVIRVDQYSEAFRRRYVPIVERKTLTALEEIAPARRVVLAVLARHWSSALARVQPLALVPLDRPALS